MQAKSQPDAEFVTEHPLCTYDHIKYSMYIDLDLDERCVRKRAAHGFKAHSPRLKELHSHGAG